eukprot:116811_1
MGLCWSSPPVVEQEVELPDLENQLSAPKPRPTAATSWTHKPAILIPATLVCLILSGFALSIFLGYNSMSETRPGSTKISIPSGNTTPIATQSGKSSASEQIDDDITIHHPTRTVTPPNKSVTTEELVSDPLQSDSEIISGGLDNSHVLEDPAKTITKPTVNIPNSNGTQPLESDSSSNILSPPKSAGTTSVETDKSSTVQNPANSATKTLGKSTSKIIVEDQAKPIAVEIVIQVTDDGSTTWMDPENEEDEMEDFQDVLGYIVKKVIAPTFKERDFNFYQSNKHKLYRYNQGKTVKETRIITFAPEGRTINDVELRVYLGPNLMTKYYESGKNKNLHDDLNNTKRDIEKELEDQFGIDATVKVYNEDEKSILPIISSTTDKSNSGQSSSETLNTSTLNISKSDNSPAPKPSTVEIVIQFTADGSITWTDPENKEEEMEDFEDVLGYIVKKVIAPTFMEREITDHEFLNKINTDRLKSYNKRKAKLFRSTSKKEIRITTFVPKDITFGEAEMRVYLAPNLMTNSYESPNYANLDDDLTKTREDIKTKLSTLFRINATVTVSKFNEAGKPILPIISSTTDKSNSGQSSSETLNTSTLNISKSDNSPAPKPSTVEIVIQFTKDEEKEIYPQDYLYYLGMQVIAPIFVENQ